MKPTTEIPIKAPSEALSIVLQAILGTIAFAALWMGYDLVRMLIARQMDAAMLAVYVGLIGSVLTICSSAVSFLAGSAYGSRRSIGPVKGDINLGDGADKSEGGD